MQLDCLCFVCFFIECLLSYNKWLCLKEICLCFLFFFTSITVLLFSISYRHSLLSTPIKFPRTMNRENYITVINTWTEFLYVNFIIQFSQLNATSALPNVDNFAGCCLPLYTMDHKIICLVFVFSYRRSIRFINKQLDHKDH